MKDALTDSKINALLHEVRDHLYSKQDMERCRSLAGSILRDLAPETTPYPDKSAGPIRKDEIDKLVNENDQALYNEFERVINQMLKENYGKYALTFSDSRLNQRLKQRIKDAYEKAGWTVELVNDQRDGDYIHFS